jgi:hypothetical protein
MCHNRYMAFYDLGVHPELGGMPFRYDSFESYGAELNAPDAVRFFKVVCAAGHKVLGAFIHNLPMGESGIPGQHFDHLTMTPKVPSTSSIRIEQGMQLPTDGGNLHMALVRLTGEAELAKPNTQRILEIIEAGAEAGKAPLLLSGLSDIVNQRWRIGYFDHGSVDVEGLLASLPELGAATGSPELSDPQSHYSLILIDSHNEERHSISPDVVSKVGVPVLYTTGVRGQPENMVLATPHP